MKSKFAIAMTVYGILALLIGLVIFDWRQGDPKAVSLDGSTSPPGS